MTYIKIGENLYPAIINGTLNDHIWDGRESKTIKLEMNYAEAIVLFVDGMTWSIVMDIETEQEDGSISSIQQEYDNNDFCVAGSITDNRDGTLSVKMGKLTHIEQLEKENATLLFENLTGEVL